MRIDIASLLIFNFISFSDLMTTIFSLLNQSSVTDVPASYLTI